MVCPLFGAKPNLQLKLTYWHRALGTNINTLRPRQNGRHYPHSGFECIFLNENVWIAIKISLKFVPKCSIINITALVQIMAWRRPGDKPLSETLVVRLSTHICVTRPQWVYSLWPSDAIWHHKTWSTLVQVIVFSDGTNYLPEPTLTYHHWGFFLHSPEDEKLL